MGTTLMMTIPMMMTAEMTQMTMTPVTIPMIPTQTMMTQMTLILTTTLMMMTLTIPPAATTASAVSYCASLSSNQCSNAYADDGSAICAVNAVNNNCYAVVASSGMYGSGNFDDGYTAAEAQMEAETQQLATIVGVLGGMIAVLVLLFVGGGYYFYKKSKLHEAQMQNMEVDDPTPHSMETGDCEPMMEAEM